MQVVQHELEVAIRLSVARQDQNEHRAAQYSVSKEGSLIYAPGSVEPSPQRTLSWVDRKGVAVPLGIKPGSYASVRVSRDDRKILLADNYLRDLFLFETSRSVLDRLNVDRTTTTASLSPEGDRIAFMNRPGPAPVPNSSIGSVSARLRKLK